MIDAINRIGEPIGAYFESLFAWEISSGIFYLSGRDIGCVIIGFLLCLILWAICDGKEIKIKHGNWHNRNNNN